MGTYNANLSEDMALNAGVDSFKQNMSKRQMVYPLRQLGAAVRASPR